MLRCALALTLLAVTLASDLRARYQMSRDPRSDRAWVRRIIERSKPGDSVVCCTGNFFPLVEYYLRSDAVGARMRLFNFPEELSRHPGWYNELKVLRDRAGLEQEARSLAVELSAIAGTESGRKVWVILVTRLHPLTAQILTDALRPTLSEVDRIDVSGNFAFYDQILAFVTRREPEVARESALSARRPRAKPIVEQGSNCLGPLSGPSGLGASNGPGWSPWPHRLACLQPSRSLLPANFTPVD